MCGRISTGDTSGARRKPDLADDRVSGRESVCGVVRRKRAKVPHRHPELHGLFYKLLLAEGREGAQGVGVAQHKRQRGPTPAVLGRDVPLLLTAVTGWQKHTKLSTKIPPQGPGHPARHGQRRAKTPLTSAPAFPWCPSTAGGVTAGDTVTTVIGLQERGREGRRGNGGPSSGRRTGQAEMCSALAQMCSSCCATRRGMCCSFAPNLSRPCPSLAKSFLSQAAAVASVSPSHCGSVPVVTVRLWTVGLGPPGHGNGS